MMKLRFVPVLAGVLVASAATLLAQDGGDGKTYTYHSTKKSAVNTSGQTAQEIEDLGEIDEKQGFQTLRDKLRFNVNARAAYTTNALLEGHHSSSDLLFLPTIEAGFHTPLGEKFSFDLSTKLESVTYTKYDERGFAGYSAMATLDYRIAKNAPRVYVSIEPYRYDSYDTGDLLTEAVGFTGGTDWGFAFNGGRTLGFIGYSFSYYLADPSIDSRVEHRVVAGIAHQLRSNLTAQLYYMYEFDNYTNFDRDDYKNTVAGNLIYQFNEHFFGSLTTAWVNNVSDQQNAGYQSFSTTLGLTVQF